MRQFQECAGVSFIDYNFSLFVCSLVCSHAYTYAYALCLCDIQRRRMHSIGGYEKWADRWAYNKHQSVDGSLIIDKDDAI